MKCEADTVTRRSETVMNAAGNRMERSGDAVCNGNPTAKTELKISVSGNG